MDRIEIPDIQIWSNIDKCSAGDLTNRIYPVRWTPKTNETKYLDPFIFGRIPDVFTNIWLEMDRSHISD